MKPTLLDSILVMSAIPLTCKNELMREMTKIRLKREEKNN